MLYYKCLNILFIHIFKIGGTVIENQITMKQYKIIISLLFIFNRFFILPFLRQNNNLINLLHYKFYLQQKKNNLFYIKYLSVIQILIVLYSLLSSFL